MYKSLIKEFFDNNYKKQEHYWWKNENRYSLLEEEHTPYYASILKEAKRIKSGYVLDIGAGEGADSIRLARLGFLVDAVEMSPVGAEKIRQLVTGMELPVNVICTDIENFIPSKQYDIVMCNGVLHYIQNKETIVRMMKSCTKTGGINCISLFSDFTPVPKCHQIVPVFPDAEGGIIEKIYGDWETLFLTYDRNQIEKSHDDMEPHVHSYIKRIWRRMV